MGKNLLKAYPLRLEEETMNKLKAVAKEEERNVNSEITKIIKDYIKSYESKNGTITM